MGEERRQCTFLHHHFPIHCSILAANSARLLMLGPYSIPGSKKLSACGGDLVQCMLSLPGFLYLGVVSLG